MTLRAHNVAELVAHDHDVLIIGGGINGAVGAAALAARGVRVALVDRADFGSATSQQSSNLIWGGIKYLENYEFSLVRKLCRSRNRLIRSYPANIREIRFFAPIARSAPGFRRTLPALNAGAWLYWVMGNCFTRPPRWLTRNRIAQAEPVVDETDVKGGLEYSDAFLLDNDARFVFGFINEALNSNATVANYVEVTGAERLSEHWSVSAVDRESGAAITIRARAIINAAGPWVDPLNSQAGIQTTARHVFSRGIHLIVDRLPETWHVLTFFDDTNRLFFVIPMHNRSVIGTTDTPVERPETHVTEEDRDFLLDNINRRLKLPQPLTRADIIAERCGVRPLVVEGQSPDGGQQHEWYALSRKHIIETDQDRKHISIFGGKLTDCLNVGEELCSEVSSLGIPIPDPRACWFGEPPRGVRREFMQQAQRSGLEAMKSDPRYETLSQRLWRRYGTGAFGMLEAIGRDPGMADPIIENSEYLRCELVYAARSEMVVRLEDFLRRRSKLALVERHDDLRAAPGIMEACRILFGRDARRRYEEYFGPEAAGQGADLDAAADQ